MAIIKILNSSKTFSAVLYNESRVEKGEAKLLAASNFSIPVENAEHYITFLKDWSSLNTRIKFPQLHVVISFKGKESNPDDLLFIAKEWLDKMGYGNNPYLIYHHFNTENSHIHIVTTRVGDDGRKINHNFERKRSQRILNEINGIDRLREFRKHLSILLRFSFSTTTQFIELVRGSGITVNNKNDSFILEKDGLNITLSKALVEHCSRRYNKSLDSKKKKSLQAKIFRYAALFDIDNFRTYMRTKFGLNFVFYGKSDKLYGFTIIDYNNNAIYKGSDIFSLKKFNELLFDESKSFVYMYNLFLREFLKKTPRAGLSEINGYLLNKGVFSDGVSYYKIPENKYIGSVDNKIGNKLLYNTRVNKILNDYKPLTSDEIKVLSKIYRVAFEDLNRPLTYSSALDDTLYYRNLLNDLIHNGDNIRKSLDLYGIELHLLNGSFVLRDAENKMVVSNNRLGIDYNTFITALNSYNDKYDYGQRYEDEYVGVDYDYEPEILLADVLYNLVQIRAAGGGVSSRKKKRK